jgi:hypothetical protein
MKFKALFTFALFELLTMTASQSQPEVAPWSNIRGIRLDGELIEMNSTLGFVGKDWSAIRKTAKERAGYSYTRNGNTQYTPIRIDSFFYDQSVEDMGAGKANVRIHFRNEKDTQIIGTFLMLELPASQYGDAGIQLVNPSYTIMGQTVHSSGLEIVRGTAQGIQIKNARRQLDISINEGTEIFVWQDTTSAEAPLNVFFALMTGHLKKGTSTYKSFTISASGTADRSPLALVFDTSNPGRPYKGFGGNFRLQNPNTDPPVIDYCLENLEVRWGRVEMPWRFWQPEEETDPVQAASQNGPHPRVEAAMKMAGRLDSLGMPVILSVWSAPDWAIEGEMHFGPQPGGLRGNPLDPRKLEKIYQSIGDYIRYAKDRFRFEFDMFSFNESDLGINVRQTPEEHAQFIKGLGAHLKKRGLRTKLLLGDTADANGWPFIRAAMDDPETHPFIGAVSFHSWRGYTDENLRQWAAAAEQMQLPLLVGEGSMDAGAWRYPDIFSEPTYAMEEMNLYIRILRICQPESILQWQLTADYSPMKGGGIFGNHDLPLTPTQRFWNFKQLANLPADLNHMPVTSNQSNVECSGLGDRDRGIYIVHLVNNGATRPASLRGLPSDIQWIQMRVTNEKSSYATRRMIRVIDGVAAFEAETNSFITLLADGESPF